MAYFDSKSFFPEILHSIIYFPKKKNCVPKSALNEGTMKKYKKFIVKHFIFNYKQVFTMTKSELQNTITKYNPTAFTQKSKSLITEELPKLVVIQMPQILSNLNIKSLN